MQFERERKCATQTAVVLLRTTLSPNRSRNRLREFARRSIRPAPLVQDEQERVENVGDAAVDELLLVCSRSLPDARDRRLYALMAYNGLRRMREIGVRLASRDASQIRLDDVGQEMRLLSPDDHRFVGAVASSRVIAAALRRERERSDHLRTVTLS